MLLILILLFTFTDFEILKLRHMFLQNLKNWIFDTYWNILEQTSSLWKSYLRTNIFKEGLVWLFCWSSLWCKGTVLVKNCSDHILKTLNANISILQEKIIPSTLIKRGGVQIRHYTSLTLSPFPWVRARGEGKNKLESCKKNYKYLYS